MGFVSHGSEWSGGEEWCSGLSVDTSSVHMGRKTLGRHMDYKKCRAEPGEALQGKDVTKIWRMSRHSNVTNIILWYSRLANNSTLCQLSMFFKKIHYRIITCRSTYGTCAIFHLRHVTSSSCFHNLAERLATKQPVFSLMSWCKVKQS